MNKKPIVNTNDTFNKILNEIMKDKGGTTEDYNKLMNSIAYHESAGTLDPTIHQYGGGPGRGKYQFEGIKGSNRILSSAVRTKRYLKSKGITVPNYINSIIEDGTGDASKLSSKEQDILFLGDLRMKGGVDLKDYVNGNLSVQDLWADHWWAGSKEKREGHIKSFNNSLRKAGYNQDNKPYTPTKQQQYQQSNFQMKDERLATQSKIDNTYQKQDLSLDKYMNRKFVNQEDSKLNSFNTGGRHEENSLGGIPQGMGSNGKPNTVEQGESSYDFPEGKFIFSDRVFINQKDTKLTSKANKNQFANGGKMNDCGGPGQPPCKDLKSIEPYLSGDKYLIDKKEIDISKNRVLDYLNSPGFERILGKSENTKNVKKIKNQRISKVNNLKINQKKQISEKGPGYFYGIYNQNTDQSVDLENYIYKGIPEHEINHASTDGNNDLNNFTKENIKKRVSHKRGYYNDPTEAQARILTTRLLLKHSGIWDYNKGEFKKEDLQKLKIDLEKNPNKYKVQDFLDLKKHVNSDEDFIWLMNNIAFNENNKKQNNLA